MTEKGQFQKVIETDMEEIEALHEVLDTTATFKGLGVCEELCVSCDKLGWRHPTKIQVEAIPYGLAHKDLIGLAVTGSGKTGAFALPVLQELLSSPYPFFALVLTPTRELALQISQQFEAIGAFIGLKTAALIGGLDLMQQAVALSRKPHVVIGTPGRVLDHLTNTKGFSIANIRYLILDEADRLLNMDFEKEINQIVAAAPESRTTFLFSATMTNKVEKLKRACLRRDAVKIEVSGKYETVDTLVQHYMFIPAQFKDTYLLFVLEQFMGASVIIFCDTSGAALQLTIVLEKLGFRAVAIFGKLTQQKRLEALNKFKSKVKNILVATDVASRGLDIPAVDLVVNYDVPQHAKNYIHRVGRTARAGRAGRAIVLVTQYDVQLYQRIEALLGFKLPEFTVEKDAVMLQHERVLEAQRKAHMELRQAEKDEEDPEIDTEEKAGDDGVAPTVTRAKKHGKMPVNLVKRRAKLRQLRK